MYDNDPQYFTFCNTVYCNNNNLTVGKDQNTIDCIKR